MLKFLCELLVYVQLALLVFAVITLCISAEVLTYKEANHGTDLSEGLPKKG